MTPLADSTSPSSRLLRLRCDPRGPQLLQLVGGAVIAIFLVTKVSSHWPTYPGWERILMIALLVFCAGVLLNGLSTWLMSWVEIDSAAGRIVVHRRTLLDVAHHDIAFAEVEAIALERSTERGLKRIYRLVLRRRRASQIVISSWQLSADALRESARELSQRIGCRLEEAD